jgi:hypothetical protein
MAFSGVPFVVNKLHKFKDRDVKRVIKAARSAGLEPTGVEVNPVTGAIRVITGKSAAEQNNALDQWMTKHAGDAQGH